MSTKKVALDKLKLVAPRMEKAIEGIKTLEQWQINIMKAAVKGGATHKELSEASGLKMAKVGYLLRKK